MEESSAENINLNEENSSDLIASSIGILKSTKELADITNVTPASSVSNKTTVDSKSDISGKEEQSKIIQTVYKNASNMEETVSSFSGPMDLKNRTKQEIQNTLESASSGRFNKLRDHSSNIFPAGIMGCKEEVMSAQTSPRRFLDSYEASKDNIGHIDSTPRKMQCSKLHPKRNPVTGTGVDATDELKRTGSRKQIAGNPVLGVGYKKEVADNSKRIPPGGRSHGLW